MTRFLNEAVYARARCPLVEDASWRVMRHGRLVQTSIAPRSRATGDGGNQYMGDMGLSSAAASIPETAPAPTRRFFGFGSDLENQINLENQGFQDNPSKRRNPAIWRPELRKNSERPAAPPETDAPRPVSHSGREAAEIRP